MQFDLIITFGWISIMMLLGVFLRAKIKFLQRALIPSSIIGGVIGLILINVGAIKVSPSLLAQMVFHLFVFSFIAIGLMDGHSGDSKKKKEKKSIFKNPLFKGAFGMACVFQVVYCVQAILGYGVIKGLNVLGLSNAKAVYGLMLPSAFANGPGQAAVAGTIYANAGYDKGVAIGLAFAALGFFVCFAIGIPVANHAIRKGLAKKAGKLSDEFLRGILKKETQKEAAGEITFHSANVETLSVHLAILLGIYLVAYYWVKAMGLFVPPQVGAALVGTMFIFALIVANVAKVGMVKMKVDHVISPPLMKRIAGWAIDYMVLTTIMAVQVKSLGEYLMPILVIALLGSIMTAALIYYFGRRIGGEIDFERSLGIFGTATGTLNTGLLLLRIVDPDFKTAASQELAFQVLIIDTVLLGIPLAFAGMGPVIFGWSEYTTILVLIVATFIYLIGLKVFKVCGKPSYSLFNNKSFQKEFFKGSPGTQE